MKNGRAVGGEGTVIRKCLCKHEFQDKKYGKGMRVHNVGRDGFRCTVCGIKKQS